MTDVRTWIEIDRHALHHNVEQLFNMLDKGTRFMAVVKSNAYGHRLIHIAKILSKFQTLNAHFHKLWFGVDSITEALRLRKEGITEPILVLGYTLPERFKEAHEQGIAITISQAQSLATLAKIKSPPRFHLKIDTGMHRQGFLSSDIPKLIQILKDQHSAPEGVYTHFASAKDPEDSNYTLQQFVLFQKTLDRCKEGGFTNIIRHAAASGAILLFPETHLDMVRIGMLLYGYWPSDEIQKAKFKNQNATQVNLQPILTWKTIVSELKEIPEGSHIGYDGTEQLERNSRIAVLPIGYWHGFDRGLSSRGAVLIRGRKAKVLGRISMDMTVVDVTDIPDIQIGDEVVLIGRSGEKSLAAGEIGNTIQTTHYEILTRINPLIRRIVIDGNRV